MIPFFMKRFGRYPLLTLTTYLLLGIILVKPQLIYADSVTVDGCNISGTINNGLLIGDTATSLTVHLVLRNSSPNPENYYMQFFDYPSFTIVGGPYYMVVPAAPTPFPVSFTFNAHPAYSYSTGKLVNETFFFDTFSPNIGYETNTHYTTINSCPSAPAILNVVKWKQGILPYNDHDPSWEGNQYADLNKTIAQVGCAMTSAAMMLNYLGVPNSDPGQLNAWLKSHNGYKSGSTNWVAVAQYARDNGVTLYYHGAMNRSSNVDTTLNNSLGAGVPVILDVSGLGGTSSHFVLATGQTTIGSSPSWTINDPAFSRDNLDPYGNTYRGIRLFTPQKAGAALYGGSSSIQILVTDPQGYRTGYDPNTGSILNEIPNAAYYTESIEDDADSTTEPTEPERIFELIAPVDGTYIVQTFGVADGDYTMHFFNYDADQNPNGTDVIQGIAAPGTAQSYVVNYISEPGSIVPVTRLVVNSTVQLQGRPAAPDARWIVPLHVVVTPQAGGALVFDQQVTTDDSGHFELNGLTPGDYRLWVKGSHTLAVAQSITVIAGENQVDIGTLREGDTDDNNLINLTDFSLLAATFGKQTGDPDYDDRADFNGDGVVNLTDFSLLATNFGQSGASS